MVNKEKIRKNFPIKIVEEVYEEQGRVCAKCDRPLIEGYVIHHKDGNNSNIEKENCQLLCSACHYGEQYKTLQEQKKEVIGELSLLIKKAIDGQVAGALMDKTLDAIKMKLSLQKQVSDIVLMEAPATSRIEYSREIAEWNLRERMNGIRQGFVMGIEFCRGKEEERGDTSKSKKKVE